MFSSIVVGIDGQAGGADAFALARQLSAPDARVTLVHVWSEVAGIAAVATGAEFPTHAAQALLDEAQRTAGVRAKTAVRRALSPGAGLHAACEELGADLIVIGASGRSSTARVLLGDATREAERGTPCAVAIAAPGTAEARAIDTVGVGYEPTPPGSYALGVARDLATGLGARLHAVRVVPRARRGAGNEPPRHAGDTARVLEEAQEELGRLGGLVGHARAGHAVEQLREFSAEVDLLVLGSGSRGAPARLLLGDTGRQLAEDCRSSLLVVPRPGSLVAAHGAAQDQAEAE